MKRVFKIAAILAGIAIIGCNRIDLVAPALISPADGAALYSGLAFIWGAGEEAEEYVIHVWTGSTDVIEDTLTDTTYTMSDSAFSALAYGIYNWAVASKADSKLEWSESRTFSLTQPGAPKLIAPQDSAVFDTEPPTFIWSSDSLEPDYVIRIFTDTTIDLQDTLADTTYTMSDSVFENLSNGTYNWQAGTVVFNGVLLSETRSFIVDKPPPPLDLDTTYFPFGLGYEWKYHRVIESYSNLSLPEHIISVVDTFSTGDTSWFVLNTWGKMGLWDVGDTIGIYETTLFHRLGSTYYSNQLHPEENSIFVMSWLGWHIPVAYKNDTLVLEAYDDGAGATDPKTYKTYEVRRVKGIGNVYQYYEVVEDMNGWSETWTLISFTTPQGQVWP